MRERTANAILAKNAQSGISTDQNKDYVKEQAETYKELLRYRKAMTAEEFNSATEEAKKLALLKQEKEYFDSISTETNEKGQIKSRSIEQIKKINNDNIKANEANYDTIEQFYGNLMRNIEEINDKQLGKTAQYKEELDLVENTVESIKTLHEGIATAEDTSFLNQQQKNELLKIALKLKQGVELSSEDESNLDNIILQTETYYNEKLEEEYQLRERINQQKSGTKTGLEQDVQEQENIVEGLKKKAADKSKAITGTQVTMAAVQGLTALNGLVQVFGNEASTAADKANAAFQGVAGGASAIADLIAPGTGILVQGVMSFGKSILESTGL